MIDNEPVSIQLDGLSDLDVLDDSTSRILEDFLRYKQSSDRRREWHRDRVKGEIVKEVLQIMDDLKLMIDCPTLYVDREAAVTGMVMIFEKFSRLLVSSGAEQYPGFVAAPRALDAGGTNSPAAGEPPVTRIDLGSLPADNPQAQRIVDEGNIENNSPRIVEDAKADSPVVERFAGIQPRPSTIAPLKLNRDDRAPIRDEPPHQLPGLDLRVHKRLPLPAPQAPVAPPRASASNVERAGAEEGGNVSDADTPGVEAGMRSSDHSSARRDLGRLIAARLRDENWQIWIIIMALIGFIAGYLAY